VNVVLWVAAGVLAAVFMAAGAIKLTRSQKAMVAAGLGWAEDFPLVAIRAIGLAEVLAAVGLLVPPAVGVAGVLAPLAAIGLALLMAGAAVVHGRRGEWLPVGVNVGLGLLAVFVAWGRLGPHPF
jgi:uncharacterized membrane protein YphA (DoxX/SURF4 family)